eukprot:TRINITY_DN73562_c0_g1_i1.p1 TRINITY_DN73562_c0_g1~~TRINITY_DN73562_c0_g1_i1.p1  ORF type:complete len:331 (-),score=69.08 TRINITY_DN73562_c0_g1_i1:92-1039(-)
MGLRDLLCPWRRSAGLQRLCRFESDRVACLELLLHEEARAAFEDYQSSESEVSEPVHPQCLKDFDRADFFVGDSVYLHGAASRDAAAGSTKLEDARLAFGERLRRECTDCFEAGLPELDSRFVRAVSVLTSQVAMAHLGSVCFGGPHSYALPSGSVNATYRVRCCKKDEKQRQVSLSLLREAKSFAALALPSGEEIECDAELSFMTQSADIVLRLDRTGGGVEVKVEDTREAMRVAFPDKRLVVHDGLALDFQSPAAPGRLQLVVGFARRCIIASSRKLLGVLLAPMRRTACVALGLLGLDALLDRKLGAKEHAT